MQAQTDRQTHTHVWVHADKRTHIREDTNFSSVTKYAILAPLPNYRCKKNHGCEGYLLNGYGPAQAHIHYQNNQGFGSSGSGLLSKDKVASVDRKSRSPKMTYAEYTEPVCCTPNRGFCTL